MEMARNPDNSASPRVAVLGIFGKTNLGNEVTLDSFLTHLRTWFPGASVSCIGPWDSRAEERYGLEDLVVLEPVPVRKYFWSYKHHPLVQDLADLTQTVTEPLRRHHARQQVRHFDALIIPGTGILDDFGQGRLDMPTHLLRWCRAAAGASVPIFFLSVGAEPVESEAIARLFAEAAGYATYRSYRDDPSKQYAEGMGVDVTKDPVYPDLAFSLPETELRRREPSFPPKVVGLGVMGYYGWNEDREEGERIFQSYMDKLLKFTSGLLDRGMSVRLLIGDTRADARPVREITKAFAGRSVGDRIIAEPIESYGDLLRQVEQTDVNVVTRFHNLLLSLLMERPCLSLSYSIKNDALLEEMGLVDHYQPIDSFSLDRLWFQFDHLVQRFASSIDQIRWHNGRFRAELDEQYARVFTELEPT